MRAAIIGVVFSLLLGCSTAAAASLIVNGGFEIPGFYTFNGDQETGRYYGWTVSGTGTYAGTYGVDWGITSPAQGPHSGQHAAWVGLSTNWTYISQDIATIPGQEYEASFWYLNNNANLPQGQSPENGAEIICGPLQVGGSDIGNTGGWKMLARTFTATTDQTEIKFGFYNTYGWWNLDDVSVDPVPEPSTLTLLGMGLIGLIGYGLRQRKR